MGWVAVAAATPPASPSGETPIAPSSALPAEEKSPSDVPRGYLSEVKKGLVALEHGVPEEARTHFLTAHRLYPNARSLRALGKVEFELRRYPAAIGYLERALASRLRPLSGAMRADVEELLAQARAYVAPFKMVTQPAVASIWIDGVRVQLPPDRNVLLTVGAHQIEVRAQGHAVTRRTVNVQDNRPGRLLLRLMPLAPDRVEADAPVYERWWLWAGLGAVVAAGVVTGLVLANRSTDVEPPGGGSTDIVLTIPES